jgi:hypothetical protein
LLVILASLGLSKADAAAADARSQRVQMHHNPQRGLPYVPLGAPGEPNGSGPIAMQVVARIDLDGSPLTNVRGKVYPIDVDADGHHEFLHFNGFRVMRVYATSGRKLWQIADPAGRVHRDTWHRDSLAVTDLEGDGRQEIAHCWRDPSTGRKQLVVRRGHDGSVVRRVDLAGSGNQECQIAAFRFSGRPTPLLLVAHKHRDRGLCPGGNFVDLWARTVAFDVDLQQLWEANTCHAGHYVYPVDADGDALAEAVFIGRHLHGPDGARRCTIAAFGNDHADALGVADLDPGQPGLEAVAVGSSGTRAVRASDCAPLWSIPSSVIENPQHMTLARLDPAAGAPVITIRQRGVRRAPASFMLDGQGRVLARYPSGLMRDTFWIQNANLDGRTGSDELVGSFARVFDGAGRLRVGEDWYWGLRGRLVREVPGEFPKSFDRWTPYPLVGDFDRDGRDEIATWSQSLIVVGRPRP